MAPLVPSTDADERNRSDAEAASAALAALNVSGLHDLPPCVHYGDRVRLWSTSNYVDQARDPGGVVGTRAHWFHGRVFCIPPTGRRPGAGDYTYVPCTFTIVPADEAAGSGNADGGSGGDGRSGGGGGSGGGGDGADEGRSGPVRYGEAISLVDEDGNTWNSATGGVTGGWTVMLGPRAEGAAGEAALRFLPASGALGRAQRRSPSHAVHSAAAAAFVRYDPRAELHIDVAGIHRYQRTGFTTRVTNFKKPSSQTVGGYLCGDGNGEPARFRLRPALKDDGTGGEIDPVALRANERKTVVLPRLASSVAATPLKPSPGGAEETGADRAARLARRRASASGAPFVYERWPERAPANRAGYALSLHRPLRPLTPPAPAPAPAAAAGAAAHGHGNGNGAKSNGTAEGVTFALARAAGFAYAYDEDDAGEAVPAPLALPAHSGRAASAARGAAHCDFAMPHPQRCEDAPESPAGFQHVRVTLVPDPGTALDARAAFTVAGHLALLEPADVPVAAAVVDRGGAGPRGGEHAVTQTFVGRVPFSGKDAAPGSYVDVRLTLSDGRERAVGELEAAFEADAAGHNGGAGGAARWLAQSLALLLPLWGLLLACAHFFSGIETGSGWAATAAWTLFALACAGALGWEGLRWRRARAAAAAAADDDADGEGPPLRATLAVLRCRLLLPPGAVGPNGRLCLNRAQADAAGASGPPPMPGRFLRAELGNKKIAMRRWRATLRWRRKNKIDSILTEPQPYFDVIKRHYSHWYQGFSKEGHLLYIERAGHVHIPEMKKAGVTMDILIRHWCFVTEYVWNRVATDPDALSISVLDMKGISMKDVGGDVMDFVKRCSGLVQEHYPERAAGVYIINVPTWFSWVWALVRPLINARTRAKMHIYAKKSIYAPKMLGDIDAEVVPKCYGGSCDAPLGQSGQERELSRLVHEITGDAMVCPDCYKPGCHSSCRRGSGGGGGGD